MEIDKNLGYQDEKEVIPDVPELARDHQHEW